MYDELDTQECPAVSEPDETQEMPAVADPNDFQDLTITQRIWHKIEIKLRQEALDAAGEFEPNLELLRRLGVKI